MVHAERPEDYLAEVCKIITDDCGHAMAWISFPEGADPKAGRRVGHVGHARGAPETWRLAWADTQDGRREVGTAVCTGQPGSTPALANAPPLAPWRDEAVKHSYASSVAIPLLANKRALGAITIYSLQLAAFPDDEVKLLRELARDAAYGIAAIHKRKTHAKLEEAPRKSEEHNRAELDHRVEERTAKLRRAYERRRLGSRSSTHSPVG
ncbi:MAG: GAF domain-containing protein [Verrucomicrobiota bacterium]|jgi:GAF domain-containing protein